MKNKPMRGFITGIFICFELYFIVSIFFLYEHVLFYAEEKSLENLIYILLIQNGVLGFGCFILFICYINKSFKYKTENNEFSSPFSSLLVMTEEGKQEEEITLYHIRSLSIIKKEKGKLLFDLEQKDTSYVQQYAVLNLVSGYWYIESLTGTYPIGIKREKEDRVYKLKTALPYRLSYHDIIYIDSYKILVQ